MKWYSYLFSDVGSYFEAKNPVESINYVDTSSVFTSNYPYNIVGVFGFGGDAIKTTTEQFVNVAKQN